ncbi:GNAT family N-acetyltransferase [Streptomyces sp. SID1121]|uniref:GNAT family N-acetyltransferase n=1 Tax=Streptomyces sp. SID1121 TaxID=3425888 RepID=UPI004056B1F7
MAWELTDDVEAFRREAGAYLARDAARNTVLLTVSELLRHGSAAAAAGTAPAAPARFGWWRERAEEGVSGAFVQTPPRPPVLGPMRPGAASALARVLRAIGGPVTGVQGGTDAARAFAEEWAAAPAASTTGLRLFRLGELTPPSPAPEGRARYATGDDVPLAVEWVNAFADEIGEPSGTDHSAATAQRVADGRLLFWEVAGEPVSLAATSLLVAGQVRVGPVYTPAAHRGHGYAAAATAAVSRAAREAGAQEVLLFTDTANPTSNALYERLGYRALEDSVVLHFADLGPPSANSGPSGATSSPSGD